MPDLPPENATVDALLRDTARRFPARTAIRTELGELDFAELDAQVSRYAAVLAHRTGVVVGLTSMLDPAFAIAYYAISRSGNTIAIVNALLGDDDLVHVLETAGVRVLVAAPAVAERARRLSARLPRLSEVVGLHPFDGRPAEGGVELREPPPPTDIACVQFTSGTTGRPKAVALSHRNLRVNAAQIAAAHGLDATSVTLNHLPAYHPMHLNSAVYAGATQVLCTSQEGAQAVAAANRHRATHFYSLPVRLARLAVDPVLPQLRLTTVRAVFSGGAALAPHATTVLSRHLGVPVVQGYGLAETSPLTHCDRPDRPKTGSVGLPVAETECRVVDVTTRDVLECGQRGEVQVRGPQVMKGYLGADADDVIDPDGWLSTGDIGHVDADGCLFLVDRLRDVFKCDNWLVSPTEIERVLLTHPGVADCVVVDQPHEFSGAVAHAFVVLGEGTDPEAVRTFVNEKVPYYQEIRQLTVVGDIPRSGTGKIQRREWRDRPARTTAG